MENPGHFSVEINTDAIRTSERTPSERDFAPSWVQSASKA